MPVSQGRLFGAINFTHISLSNCLAPFLIALEFHHLQSSSFYTQVSFLKAPFLASVHLESCADISTGILHVHCIFYMWYQMILGSWENTMNAQY